MKEGIEYQYPSSDKEQQWREFVERFKHEADRLGYGIEPGILKAVAGLNALEINTSQSCHGHVDRGRIAPWVDVQAQNEPKQYVDQDRIYQEVADEFGVSLEESERSIGERGKEAWLESQNRLSKQDYTPEYLSWLQENKIVLEKVKVIVEEFQEDQKQRGVPENLLLQADSDRVNPALYIGKEDYYTQEQDRTEEEKKKLKKRIIEYRKEFNKFAEFLKKKFFEL